MTTARDTPLLAALVCSGFAALGYEIIWTRLCAPILGSETLGVLATLAGFFGGMALGAALWHRRAASGPDPLGLFVRLELGAAAFAVASPFLLHALGGAIPAWLGPDAGLADTPAHVALAVAIAAVVMLPGTVCIGGTLAAVVEARRRVCVDDDDSRGIARLYAANTFGAVLGVLATVHLVIPAAGLGFGAAVLAAMGACAAVLAQRWARRVTIPAAPRPASAIVIDTSGDPDPDVREPMPLLVLLGGAGLVGVGLEVAGVLVLSQVLENTIYTFANVLAVYLAGTAIGAWIWGLKGARWSHGRPATTAAALLIALGLATVLAAVAIVGAPEILDLIAPKGAGYGSHLLAELAVAASVFVVPTMLMGALFSHVMGLVAPGGIGRALAVNTAGGAIAPFIFGVWAPAALGYRDGFYLVAYGYLLVFGAFTWFRRFKPMHQIALILAVVAATALGPRDLILGPAASEPGLDAEWTVLASHQSAMGLVMVKERSDTAGAAVPLRRLQIGRHFRMGGAMSFGERRMGHLPLLLAPGATRALYLGVGTGATLGAVRAFSGLQHIDAVEIVPEVLAELGKFDAINARVRDDDRVTFHAADARRFVAASPDRYDVIVADLFHPGQDGAGGLYSREHFERALAHLTDGGVFAQWLPVYQLDAETLAIIVCTFADVFPGSHAFLGIYNVQTPAVALVGRRGGEPLAIDTDALQRQLAAPIYAELLMQDPRDLYASHLLDGAGIDAVCGDAPLNTDLWPHVTLRAPRVAYEGRGTHGAENLARLLELRTPLAGDDLRIDDGRRPAVVAEAEAFGTALAHYLEGELLREAGGDPTAFGRDAIAKYLEAFAAAPEFTPPRGMLLAAARSRAALAEQVLPRMLELAPHDRRVWAAWLTYLQETGDDVRLEAARAEAERLRE